MSKKIWAVAFGGPSPEHEISILTALQAERILSAGSNETLLIYQATNGAWFQVPKGLEADDFTAGVPSGSNELEMVLSGDPGVYQTKGRRKIPLKIDAALLCFHGGLGEGGGASALFNLLDIPATGSSVFAAAVGMDKLAFGGLMKLAGISALPREALSMIQEPGFSGPMIVKPRFGGSSIGIEIVQDIETARAVNQGSSHLKQGAVIEPYRPDLVDLNISFRTYPKFEVTELERPIRSETEKSGLYSYQEKYLAGDGVGLDSAPREFPAQVSDELRSKARSLASRVCEVTGLTGILRLDLLWDEKTEDLFVNEINTIPGALALYLWAPSTPALTILEDALRESELLPRAAPSTGFAQGIALRSAGGIAGKLRGLDGPLR